MAISVHLRYILMTSLNCLTSKSPVWCKNPDSYISFVNRVIFCAKIHHHGNKGRSEVNFNMTIRFSDHDCLKRVGYFGDQKSFCVISDEFITWTLTKPKPLARQINNLFPVSPKKYTITYSHTIKLVAKYGEDWMKSVIFRREILKMGQEHLTVISKLTTNTGVHIFSQTPKSRITSWLKVLTHSHADD